MIMQRNQQKTELIHCSACALPDACFSKHAFAVLLQTSADKLVHVSAYFENLYRIARFVQTTASQTNFCRSHLDLGRISEALPDTETLISTSRADARVVWGNSEMEHTPSVPKHVSYLKSKRAEFCGAQMRFGLSADTTQRLLDVVQMGKVSPALIPDQYCHPYDNDRRVKQSTTLVMVG